MVQSIRLEKTYRIDVGQDGKFVYDGIKMSIKDVPIIRINFSRYADSEIEYINGLLKVFMYSIVFIEIHVENIGSEDIAALKQIDDKCAIYLYLDIDDMDIDSLDDSKLEMMDAVFYDLDIDGISMVDKTSKLNAVTAKKLVNDIASTYGIENEKISICKSPLSCTGYACVTAVKARELMAIYSKVDDVPLPTANHEKSCCGCIQYIKIEHDVERQTKNISSSEKRSTNKIKKKTGIKFGLTRL